MNDNSSHASEAATLPPSPKVAIPRWPVDHLTTFIAAFGVALVMAVWGMAWYGVNQDRDIAITSQMRKNANIARMIDEHANGMFQSAAANLHFLKLAAEASGLRLSIKERLPDFRFASNVHLHMLLIDERGDIVNSTLPNQRPVNVADRNYFSVQAARSDVGLYVGEPVIGKVTSTPTFHLSERINKQDGSFGGVAVLMIDPQYFANFYMRLELGQDDVISLVGRDQVIRAARYGARVTAGDVGAHPGLWRHLEGAAEGNIVGAIDADGIARIYSYRALQAFPLVAVVGTSMARVIAGSHGKDYLIIAAFITILTLGAGILITRSLARAQKMAALLAVDRERITLALTHSSVALWDHDIATGSIYLSDEWSVMRGLARAESSTTIKELLALVHPDDLAHVVATSKAFATEKISEYRTEHRIQTVTGDWIWIESVGQVSMRDEHGRPSRVSGVNTDITGLKRIQLDLEHSRRALEERTIELAAANDQLTLKIAAQSAAETLLSEQLERVQESEARNRLLASIVEQTRDAVIARDLNGRVITWNTAAVAMFGYSAEEAIGQPLSALHLSNLTAAERQITLDRIRSGVAQDFERTMQDRAGRTFAGWISTAPLFDAKGQRFGTSAIMRDLTERKRMESALREAADAARAASEAKSVFLANMSHEIRTPMNGVLGMTELVLGTELTPSQREQLTIALSSGRALLGVIDDILDFSKVEAGHLDLDAIEFSPAECVNETVRMFALPVRQKGLSLDWQASAEVPERVIGDPGRLRQILVNLLGNAVKFTTQGEIEVRLEVVEHAALSVLLAIHVRDTGIGIPPEKLRTIFDPFSQADASTTRRYGGTGLGLSITARLAELMGGRAWVDSTIGQGSTFHVTLRCDLASASRPDAPTPPNISTETASPLLPRNARAILLVENNPVNQLVGSMMIKRVGHHVTIAADGMEAINALAARRFDLILMDMQMPVMDGLEATAAIRARETRDLRTAHSDHRVDGQCTDTRSRALHGRRHGRLSFKAIRNRHAARKAGALDAGRSRTGRECRHHRKNLRVTTSNGRNCWRRRWKSIASIHAGFQAAPVPVRQPVHHFFGA